jgi:hypothetical protein
MMRNNDWIIEDFPAPVLPTIPTLEPGQTLKDNSLIT